MNFDQQSVFVYGTLKPGGRYWQQYCEGKLSGLLEAKIRGQLYDLQVGYPGLLLGGADWVYGYVLQFAKRADFEQLDVLEDFVPGRPLGDNEYLRIRVQCFDPATEVALGHVWAYEMTRGRLQSFNARRLEDGQWPIA